MRENRGDKLTLQKTMNEPTIVKSEVNTRISRLFLTASYTPYTQWFTVNISIS